MSDASDKTFLSSLVAAKSPSDVLGALAKDEVPADENLAERVSELAQLFKSEGRERDEGRARRVEALVRATDRKAKQASDVHSLADLVDWLDDSSGVQWAASSHAAFTVIAKQARLSGHVEFANELDRCLSVWSDLLTLVQALLDALQGDGNVVGLVERSPLLISDEFLRYLQLRAEAEATFGGTPMLWRAAAQGMTDLARIRNAAKEPNRGMPAPQVVAAQWYRMLPEEVLELFADTARKVAERRLTLSQAIEYVLSKINVDDPVMRAQLTGQFLENGARDCPASLLPEYTWATRLLADKPLPPVHPHLRAVHALHHAVGVQERWRGLTDPYPVIADAAELLESVLPEVDVRRSARLLRDVHLYRARLIELLAQRDATRLDEAIREYQASLDVAGAAHDHLVRGQAFSDLANALSSRLTTCGEGDEDVIDRTYERALSHIDGAAEPAVRASVLGNRAMFLNQRETGDLGRNQEVALKLAREGLDLLDAAEASGRIEVPRIRFLRGGLHRTVGNALESRLYGDPIEMNKAALDAYERGLTSMLGDDLGAIWIRGTLQLNRGNVLLNLAQYGDDPEQRLLDAEVAFQEAAVLLEGDPGAHASALAGRAVASFHEPTDETVADLREGIKEFESASAPVAAAMARHNLALLLDRNGDREGATSEFLRASAAFARGGDLARATIAALRASRLAWLGSDATESERILTDAEKLVDELWRTSRTTEDRFEVAELLADVSSDLLWVRAQGAIAADAAWQLAQEAKHPHLRHRLEELHEADDNPVLFEFREQVRLERRQLDVVRWKLQREPVRANQSLADLLSSIEDEADELEVGHAATRNRVDPMPALEALLRAIPRAMIIDVTVAQFGTTVLVHSATGTKIVQAPLTRTQLRAEMARWRAAYEKRTTNVAAWRSATEQLLELLGTSLVQSLPLADMADMDVFMIPGELFGLPLHGAPVSLGGQVVTWYETLSSFRYAPAASALKSGFSVPKTALCVLADPATGLDQLTTPPDEVASVTEALCVNGVAVSVIVARGKDQGRAVLAGANVHLSPAAKLHPERPTPKRILELALNHQHIFFTGHGGAQGLPSLQLVDDNGDPADLTGMDLFAAKAVRGRQFVLSACETATQSIPNQNEPMSLVAFLLRLGAEWILSTAWVVREDVAARFTTVFYERLVEESWDAALAFKRTLIEVRGQFPRVADWAAFMLFRGISKTQ